MQFQNYYRCFRNDCPSDDQRFYFRSTDSHDGHHLSKTFTIGNKRWIPHTRKFKTANETSVQDLETGFKTYLEFSLLGFQGFVWIPVDSCGFQRILAM